MSPASTAKLARFESAFTALINAAQELRSELTAQAGESTDDIERIKALVAKEFSVNVNMLVSDYRWEPLATARMTAVCLCIRNTQHHYRVLARAFCYGYPRSVKCADQSIKWRIQTDPVFAARFNALDKLLQKTP